MGEGEVKRGDGKKGERSQGWGITKKGNIDVHSPYHMSHLFYLFQFFVLWCQ